MPVLSGQSILITGAGSGLGRAVLDRFVEEGADVTAFDVSERKLTEITTAHGPGVRVSVGNVTSATDNAAAVATALAGFGRLDVFIGNAGIWDFGRGLLDTDIEQLGTAYDELFAVNVKGYLFGAKASVQALRESKGSMVFTLSNAAFFPGGGGPLYTASKHAGLGLVRQLAYELSPDVRVNGVAPGGMATDLRGPGAMGLEHQSISEAMPIQEYLRRHTALEVAVEPEDYVGPYVLLASRRDSRSVTGAVFDVSSVGTPRRPEPL